MMKKQPLSRKSSAPDVPETGGSVELFQPCTIRFLDDSEPMTVHFKVGPVFVVSHDSRMHQIEVGVASWNELDIS